MQLKFHVVVKMIWWKKAKKKGWGAHFIETDFKIFTHEIRKLKVQAFDTLIAEFFICTVSN